MKKVTYIRSTPGSGILTGLHKLLTHIKSDYYVMTAASSLTEQLPKDRIPPVIIIDDWEKLNPKDMLETDFSSFPTEPLYIVISKH